jgi:hypothetical protein
MRRRGFGLLDADSINALYGHRLRGCHERLKNLKEKAANTNTMPTFTIGRSKNRFLKNAKSAPTITAAIASA